MSNKILEELVRLGIYSSKMLSEEDYNKLLQTKPNNSLIYISGRYDGVIEERSKYFKEINTNGLTPDDVKLQLEIDKIKMIKSIKNMLTFFIITTIIGFIMALLI